jgi:diacylglycerol kinase family enzyme
LLVVYGGDGTVAQVATELLEQHSRVPMAPLHGGTANALASYLNIPQDLEEALSCLLSGAFVVRPTDVGLVRSHAFFLRTSIGFAAGLTHHATREQKDALGVIAYALSALQAVRETTPATFTLTIDGVTTSHEAIACIIANTDGTGTGSPLASHLDECNARLDALLVPSVGWAGKALANAASGVGLLDGAPRRSGKVLRVDCSTEVPVHADGEHVGSTPVEISVRHGALRLASRRTSV